MGPIDAAGAAALGNAMQGSANIIATGRINKKTREWNEKILEKQRGWALEDFDRNSPAAQMKRLKEAGLNPHLVYGNGADANIPIRGADAPSWNPQTPDLGGDNPISAYQSTQLRQAQTNNVELQNTLAEQQLANLKIQANLMNQDLLDKRFGYELKGELRPYNVASSKKAVEMQDVNILKGLVGVDLSTGHYNLAKLRSDREQTGLDLTVQQADLQRQIMRMSLKKTDAEIENIKVAMDNMKKDGTLKDYLNEIQNRLKRLNLTNSDPAHYKIITEAADNLGKRTNIIKKVYRAIK